MYMVEVKENAYKSYIADVLRLAVENLHRLCGAGYYEVRWADIVNPPKEEDMNGDDIAIDVMRRASLSFKEIQE